VIRTRGVAIRIALSVGCTLLSAAHADAQAGEPLHATLAVVATGDAAGCVEADALATRVEGILGRDVIRGDAGRVQVRIDVARDALRTRATVTLVEAGAPRDTRDVVHEGRRCAAIAGPLSVVVAMLLDDREHTPTLDVTTAAETPTPAPPPTRRPPTPTTVPTTRDDDDARTTHWIAQLVPALGVGAGLLPGAAFLAELGGRLGPPRAFALTLGLAALPWARAGGAPGGDFSAFRGAIGVCAPGAMDPTRLTLGGCVAVGAAAIRGRGAGLARVYEQFEPWVDVEAALELHVPLGARVALSLRVGALVPLLRPIFFARIDDADVVLHDPWPVVPTVTLALPLTIR
jgi:hypothetical protein